MGIALGLSALLILLAYGLGSIPTGYWAGRWLQGIDIREVGSSSTGATNVLRTLGKKAALAVLTIDVLKGMAAVGLVRLWFQTWPLAPIPPAWQNWLLVATALGAVLGHSKSFLLNFSGGKSVATSLGVLFVLNPWLALGALATFLLSLALTRIVSVSSILGAVAVNGVAWGLALPLPFLLFSALAGLYVILRHRSNIQRLLAGTEPRLGQKLTVPNP
jgi:glycerol-3-phosphate acyltransferase PlsY